MKKVSLSFVIAFLFFGLPLHGQEVTKLYGTYKDYMHFYNKEIRTMVNDCGNFVLLETGFYPEKDYSNSLRRRIWFCLEQKEIPLFINFLDKLSDKYQSLARNNSDAQLIGDLDQPMIGRCMVADFENHSALTLERWTQADKPYYCRMALGQETQLRDYVFINYSFENKDGSLLDGESKILCGFGFDSSLQISDLINQLNKLLPKHLKVK